jgi:hypothetical protein
VLYRFPCLAIYLTFFYTKKELALRIGYLFASAALAGACGGLLAYGIGYMDYTSGMRGWRWIMIIEGKIGEREIPRHCYSVLVNRRANKELLRNSYLYPRRRCLFHLA